MKKFFAAALLPLVFAAGCAFQTTETTNEQTKHTMWNSEFTSLLPLLGHHNWILIVDRAYPLQSGDGIVTLDTKEKLDAVLGFVLAEIDAAPHVKPFIYKDLEMGYLNEEIAPGVSDLRAQIDRVLADRDVKTIPHDEVFTKIDDASQLFQTVVLKTSSTIAYSSVFIELDCGYWTAEAEKTLRERINVAK